MLPAPVTVASAETASPPPPGLIRLPLLTGCVAAGVGVAGLDMTAVEIQRAKSGLHHHQGRFLGGLGFWAWRGWGRLGWT